LLRWVRCCRSCFRPPCATPARRSYNSAASSALRWHPILHSTGAARRARLGGRLYLRRGCDQFTGGIYDARDKRQGTGMNIRIIRPRKTRKARSKTSDNDLKHCVTSYALQTSTLRRKFCAPSFVLFVSFVDSFFIQNEHSAPAIFLMGPPQRQDRCRSGTRPAPAGGTHQRGFCAGVPRHEHRHRQAGRRHHRPRAATT